MPSISDLAAGLAALAQRVRNLEVADRAPGWPEHLADLYTLSGVPDNVATPVFTITTTDEAPNYDAGLYLCTMQALVTHSNGAGSGAAVSLGLSARFARAMKGTGVGNNSAVVAWGATASNATDPASRDISSVTVAVSETSEYVQTVTFQVNLTGTMINTATVVVAVELLWFDFLTPPTLAPA